MNTPPLTIGQSVTLACLLEVAAPKPGNVHRGADFDNLVLEDFLVSATLFGNIVDQQAGQSLGKTVLESIKQTQMFVQTNTNLGLVLLMAPLAKAAQEIGEIGPDSVSTVLGNLNETDAADVFAAIRLAEPGGMGQVEKWDVFDSSTGCNLMEAMESAADRDLVAAQFTNRFQAIFETAVPLIREGTERFRRLSEAIVYAHVAMLATFGDSLIERKCGATYSNTAKAMASKAMEQLRDVESTDPAFEPFWNSVGELDFWLRSDGHRRNPGTTADLIAAALFVAIQLGVIKPPYR